MKYNLSLFLLTLAFFVGVFSPVEIEASSVIRSGETVSLASTETVDGNFYTGARQINISGQVNGDLVSAGIQVGVNGNVQNDIFILAHKTDVYGAVGDDVRIIAGEVTISEAVAGDVFVVGGTVKILSTASVGGNVIVFGGDATIDGHVTGDVLGSVKNLRIDAQVDGGVDVTTDQLTLGSRANIAGSVKYVSYNKLLQSPEAMVGGDVLKNDPVSAPVRERDLTIELFMLLTLLFSVLVWYWLSRETLQKVTDRTLEFSIRNFLFGFTFIIFALLASLILLVSGIGLFVGLVSLLVYGVFLLMAMIALPSVIGHLLIKSFSRKVSQISPLTLFIGIIGVTLCILVPVVGHVLLAGLFVLILGAMVSLLIKKKEETK
jgi:hypothetical protein